MNQDSSGNNGPFLQMLAYARGGQADQQAAFLESFRDYLRRIATQMIGQQTIGQLSASDLVQCAMIDAQNELATCRAQNKAEFRAWLRQILVHDILNRYRDLRRDKRDVRRERPLTNPDLLGDTIASPSDHAIREEDTRRLTSALSQLPEEQQRVITMRQRDQMTFVEIGRQLGRTPDSVRMIWNRAIEALAKVLRES